MAYKIETCGDTQRPTARFEYSAIGEMTIAKPDWAVGVTPAPTSDEPAG